MQEELSQESKPLAASWGRVFWFWWAWTWRWFLFSFVVNFALAVPLMGISLILGGTNLISDLVTNIGTFIGMIGLQIYTLWNLLDEDLGGFVVSFQENQVPQLPPEIQSSTGSVKSVVSRFWWSWFWKSFIGFFLISFFLGILSGVILITLGLPIVPESPHFRIILPLLALALSTFFSLKWVFSHRFPGFKVVIMPVS
jgi:hypothetical protein